MFFPRHARRRNLSRIEKFSLVVLILAGLGISALSGIALAADLKPTAPRTEALPPTVATVNPTPVSTIVPTPAASGQDTQVYPVSLSIPSISVQASVTTLGLTSTGALAAPSDLSQAGWFTGSSVPGHPGPAVLAGHVDSTTGPAVFYKLADLKPGATITVALSDQSSARFVVTEVESYSKDAFPTANVYGPVPDAELRVITCGGTFSDGHYLNNVVVYATLASS